MIKIDKEYNNPGHFILAWLALTAQKAIIAKNDNELIHVHVHEA
jgi:hypothetical protein